MQTIYHILKADFLERIRRYSFLMVMAATVYAGIMMLPPLGSSYTAFVVGGCRAYYSSAWVGTIFGIVASTMLSLFGFYLVRNAVNRDYQTRVGRIIATTRTKKWAYLFGKWLSNVAVLSSILLVSTIIGPLMQLFRAEDTNLDLLAVIAPIWLMGLPVLAVVAALAVLFEAIPFLQAGWGNVIYFFIWAFLLLVLVGSEFDDEIGIKSPVDVAGVAVTLSDIREQMISVGLDPYTGTTDLFEPTDGRIVDRFHWNGIQWSGQHLLSRLAVFGFAFLIVIMGVIPFDRFDPALRRYKLVSKIKKLRKKKATAPEDDVIAEILPFAAEGEKIAAVIDEDIAQLRVGGLRRFLNVFRAELRLMFRQQKWFWYLVFTGMIITMFAAPFIISTRLLLPIMWLWPTLLWSAMGARERKHQTHQMIFSTSKPIRFQLPALWLVGVVVAVLAGLSGAIRLAIGGQPQSLLYLPIGAVFVSSLALALGVWSNSSRPFEIIYVIIVYIGLAGSLTVFDFAGITEQGISAGIPLYYLLVSVALFALAVVGRRKQLGV